MLFKFAPKCMQQLEKLCKCARNKLYNGYTMQNNNKF